MAAFQSEKDMVDQSTPAFFRMACCFSDGRVPEVAGGGTSSGP